MPESACHAGGRGFESRRSRLSKCLQICSLCCLFRRSLSCSRPSRGPRSENKNPANSDFASELVAGRTNKNGSAGAWRSFVAWSGETSCRTSGRTGSRPVARIPVVSTRSRAVRSGSRNPQARDRLAVERSVGSILGSSPLWSIRENPRRDVRTLLRDSGLCPLTTHSRRCRAAGQPRRLAFRLSFPAQYSSSRG